MRPSPAHRSLPLGIMDDERLILEVKQHQILYNGKDPFYKDNARKHEAWRDIAEALGVTADHCRGRWKMLRDTYVRHRKQFLLNGSGGENVREWKYSQIMSFLLPHARPSRIRNKKILANNSDNDGSETSVSDERPFTPVPSVDPSTSTLKTGPTLDRKPRPSNEPVPQTTTAGRRGAKRKTGNALMDVRDRLIEILQEPASAPPRPEGPADESYHFALSIVPMLNVLDYDRRQEAKIQILSMLHYFNKAQDLEQRLVHWPVQQSSTEGSATAHTSGASGIQRIVPLPANYLQSQDPVAQLLVSAAVKEENCSEDSYSNF